MICCQNLSASVPCLSPFTEPIAEDWYDGPQVGVFECQHCQRAYRLVRVEFYCSGKDYYTIELLWPIPRQQFERIVKGHHKWVEKLEKRGHRPQVVNSLQDLLDQTLFWLVFVPLMLLFPGAYATTAGEMLRYAGQPELVVVREYGNKHEKILQARSLVNVDVLSVSDWASFLDLPPDEYDSDEED